jgi:hypothetical protein
MTVIEEVGMEASRSEPCPLCGHDHYCYLIKSPDDRIVKVVCQWTDDSPDGWDRVGIAKDGRGIFTTHNYRRKRRFFPDFVQLTQREKDDIPEWQDYILDMSGKREPLPTYEPSRGKGQEQAIEYFYPSPEGKPLGKVVRRQWEDRRRVYDNNRKTKHVRPWHWVGDSESGFWSDRGKGEFTWPLYREPEAKEEVLLGGFVFAVAGEQAVEAYRQLGLTAVTVQGGEANYKQIAERLAPVFRESKDANLKPVLVIHPDNDITGDSKFGEGLLKECEFWKIPSIVMNPFSLWPEMPQGGDIWDWVHKSGQTREHIISALETEIDIAIEQQEIEEKARTQRSRWQAPESWQGEVGHWRESEKEGRFFIPKCDFDFQVERELVSDDGGGLLLQVKRTDDRSQKRVFLKSTDFSTAQKFKDSLKRGLGCGIVCNLTNFEVEALIRVRLHEYRITRKGKAFRLVDRIGQQEDGTWVFKRCQFTKDGNPTDEAQSLYCWNDKLTGEESTLSDPKIPTQDTHALKRLVDVMRRAFGNNIYPALLTLGYAAAGVHYQTILAQEGAFPTLNLFGDPGSGKTTAAECALSLVGMHGDGMMCDISLSAAYERLKLAGSLLHCLDDPTRTPELNAFLKGFYNGKARVVRGKEVSFNVQKPHSPMMVTSNHACGENDAATQSRLIRLFFARSSDGEREAFYELPIAQNQAAGCLTQLIKLGYPASEVHKIEQALLRHLPHAHIRISKSLALVTYYTAQVIKLANAQEDIWDYVVRTICPAVNDPDEAGDSVRDFLEKIFELQSRSLLGDWNMRWVEKESGKVLAVYIPGVWQALDAEFKPAYNRKIIESLLIQQGIQRTRQRFHRSEDESRAFYRAKLTPRYDAGGEEIPPNPPETTLRWCYEVPEDFLRAYSEKNRSTRSTEVLEGEQSPSETDFPLLISTDQQRSTEDNREKEERSVDLFFDQQTTPVDRIRSTSETVDITELEPPKEPLLISLIEKNTGCEEKGWQPNCQVSVNGEWIPGEILRETEEVKIHPSNHRLNSVFEVRIAGGQKIKVVEPDLRREAYANG